MTFELLSYLLPDHLFAWLLSIPAFYLFYLSRHWTWQRFVGLHLPVSMVLGLVCISCSMLVMVGVRMYAGALREGATYWTAYWRTLKNTYAFGLSATMNYWFLLILLLAWDFYRRYKAQSIASAELESRLTRSQLQALKMQLQPHFLFNAFNTISMLVRRRKNDQAVAMISGLSDLLRTTLTKPTEQLVPLQEEIDLLNKYLQIELVRFQDRLTVNWDIAPDTLAVPVPNLLLQPIVENAFKYGISQSLDAAILYISSQLIANQLKITIFNTGSQLPEGWQLAHNIGIGLDNTITRLRQLYGTSYVFQISNSQNSQGGVEVLIMIPNLNL